MTAQPWRELLVLLRCKCLHLDSGVALDGTGEVSICRRCMGMSMTSTRGSLAVMLSQVAFQLTCELGN